MGGWCIAVVVAADVEQQACPNSATRGEALIGTEGQQIDGGAGLMDGGLVGRQGGCVWSVGVLESDRRSRERERERGIDFPGR